VAQGWGAAAATVVAGNISLQSFQVCHHSKRAPRLATESEVGAGPLLVAAATLAMARCFDKAARHFSLI
jgi:hypothetical protein